MAQAKFIVYPESVVQSGNTTYSLEHNPETLEKRLVVQGDTHGFDGVADNEGRILCKLTPHNANTLRARLTWLSPVPLGLRTSAGMGDRLGLATPGHVTAVAPTPIAPIFAQQSVRENVRTGRKPQEVMDDAMWGVFQTGWKKPWGADADHLKTVDVLPEFVKAGYTFFTVDPGDYVDQDADSDSLGMLHAKAETLPWSELGTTLANTLAAFAGCGFKLESTTLCFDETTILRAVVKYGKAVAHGARMYRELVRLFAGRPFDFEVSVDETATPTSIPEHFYIAAELKRLGVTWTSLAPRFVGKFEKGVDYIGDLPALDENIRLHAEVMRYFGSYKLSLHSGSDKFSVYPIAARHAKSLVHLKTAGTSYLEALRVIARRDPALFMRIYTFARGRYETDRASYHVSAVLEKTPAAPTTSELPDLLNQFDARQVLHVTFGSVLDTFHAELYQALRTYEEDYIQTIAAHFRKHLEPLIP